MWMSTTNTAKLATKRIAAICITAILSAASVQAWAKAESGAIATVQSYMALLFVGDTAGMSSHLNESMLSERGAVLGNPNYGRTLAKAYRGAVFNVVESEQLSAERALVTVKITLASADALHVQFELTDDEGGYKIVNER